MKTWKKAILRYTILSIRLNVGCRSKPVASGGVVAKRITLPMMVGTARASDLARREGEGAGTRESAGEDEGEGEGEGVGGCGDGV